ncbi:metal binding domain of Ada-domain-containing protein [Aspergillus karnatakaensis]|uniref:putative DNA repair and transcription factor Ada n=1 Tax=Aspergillus karnatakaensis TaxID=1810916 RepID=UPI003CCCA189
MSQKSTVQRIPRLPRSTAPTTSTAIRWQAVVNRDPTATSFVYAVLTTKIYCRPSCAARLARRANIDFYDTPSEAERAGFRACKRCKPETLKPAPNPQMLFVQKACQTIRSDIQSGSKPTLTKLAGEAGLTPSHFHRVFKKIMGVTPGKYAAGILKGSEGENGGNPLDEIFLGGKNQSVFQPWDEKLCADLDAWLMGDLDWNVGGGVGAGVDNAPLWNDFDALIAAEADFVSFHGSSESSPLSKTP